MRIRVTRRTRARSVRPISSSHARSILVRRVGMGRRSIGEETTDVVSRHDLDQVPALYMSHLDECRFKRQDEGVMDGCVVTT
jgi:hypothetical protein